MEIALFTVGILQVCFILNFSLNNAAQVKFTNVVCNSYNKSWMLIHRCHLKAINRNKTVLNFNGTVLHPANDITVESQFSLKANGYKPWLYKPKFDVCRFLKKPYNPIVILAYNLVKNFTNFNHTCPYVGSQIVDGLHILYDTVPVPWPSGEFLLEIDWLFEKRLQFSTNVYFTVVE
ncbi:uncharacterized protein LOC111603644 [Drosophila hydei]|uniref:Uncharacterized protein LOC111603644 n=1 Tax=Drosophila hydei TaxID=7224 RepID=A0A6J1MJ50_DROHY|nr:uncharacterized protein LOC111603644 [Drosophila hydei]